MLVTVFCDASLCLKSGAAGVAYCLISERGRYSGRHSGIMPESNHAEMAAVFMAISKAVALWDNAKTFCINSDSMFVVDVLSGKKKLYEGYNDGGKMVQIYSEIEKMSDYLGLDIYAKHIKAHTGKNDLRSEMNRRADLMSRKAMLEKKDKLNWSV